MCFEVDGGHRMVEQEWVQELEDTDHDGTPVAIAFVQIPPAGDLW
jgi:hypothetical protein